MNGSNEGCVQRRLQRPFRAGAGGCGGYRPPVSGLDHRAHPDRLLGAPVGMSGRLHVPDARRRDHGSETRSRRPIGLHTRDGPAAATGNRSAAGIPGSPARQGHQGARRDPHERHASQGPPVGNRGLPDLQHRATRTTRFRDTTASRRSRSTTATRRFASIDSRSCGSSPRNATSTAWSSTSCAGPSTSSGTAAMRRRPS